MGVGVGMGSSPAPGIRVGTAGAAGANSDKALLSSGIFPVVGGRGEKNGHYGTSK